MNILFLDSPSFAKEDMIDAFSQLGYQVDLFFHPDYRSRHSSDFELAFQAQIETQTYDFVFSFSNFVHFPFEHPIKDFGFALLLTLCC